jgi:hypothetical protein
MKSSLDVHLKETGDPFAEFKNGLNLPEKSYSSIRAQRNAMKR